MFKIMKRGVDDFWTDWWLAKYNQVWRMPGDL